RACNAPITNTATPETPHMSTSTQALIDPSPLPDEHGGPGDVDPQETAEWRDAFDSLLAAYGKERAAFMLDALQRQAAVRQVAWRPPIGPPLVNTIPVAGQPEFPGDAARDRGRAPMIRWNALAMVVPANEA